jgi:hypothetical protein
MAKRRAFTGFREGDVSPVEVNSLGPTVAMLQGQADGLRQRMRYEASQQLAGPVQLASSLAERITDALGDPLGDGAILRDAVARKLQGQVVAHLLPPLEAAASFGYQPIAAAGQGKGGKKRRRKSPQTEIPKGENPPMANDPGVIAPPNLATTDPSYLVIVNCRLGRAASIPGLFTPNYAAAGWVPIAYVGHLQQVPAQQVPQVWATLLAQAGCAPAVVPPGPPRPDVPPNFPPGFTLPPLPVPAAAAAPQIRVAGAGEELPETPAPLLGVAQAGQYPQAAGYPAGWITLPQGATGAPSGYECVRPGSATDPTVCRPIVQQQPPIAPGGVLPLQGQIPLPGPGGLPGGQFPPIAMPPGGVAPPFPVVPGGFVPPIAPGMGGSLPLFPVVPSGSLPVWMQPFPALPGAMPSLPLSGPGGVPPPLTPGPPIPGVGTGGFIPVQGAPCPAPVINLTCPALPTTMPCPACACPVPVPQLPTQPAIPPSVVVNVPEEAPPGVTVVLPPEEFFAPGLPGEPAPPKKKPTQEPPAPSLILEVFKAAGNPAFCLPGQEVIKFLQGKTLGDLLTDIGFFNDQKEPKFLARAWEGASMLADPWKSVSQGFLKGVNTLLEGVFNSLVWAQKAVATGAGCDGPDVSTAALIQGLLGLFRKYVSDIPEALTRPWDYYSNWACPVGLPSSDWANEALARGQIKTDEWECLIRANGDKKEWQHRDVAMRQQQPTADELLLLFRKGELKEDDFVFRMRMIGWTQGDNLYQWRQAQQWVPSPSDAINWMLKDVADPIIQETFQLGNEFKLKYNGHVKEVFDWNGISETEANNLWRAHWRNMSPHTLYEMHKRLRPGRTKDMTDAEALTLAQAILPRRPVRNGVPLTDEQLEAMGEQKRTWLDQINNGAQAKVYLETLNTTGFHVFEALGQADYPPFWRDRLLAISYNVLTRVDIRRAYETGQFTKDQVVSKLQDRGYSPGDSVTLSGFFEAAAIQLASRRPAANNWVKLGFSKDLLKQALIDTGMRVDMWPKVEAILDNRRKIEVQTECLKSAKKQYLLGTTEDTDLYNILMGIGVTGVDAVSLMEQWKCERRARPKQVTAASVCKYYKQSIISKDLAKRMLREMGYTQMRAARIVESCDLTKPPKNLLQRKGRPDAAALAEDKGP